jgi:hypothetical protein
MNRLNFVCEKDTPGDESSRGSHDSGRTAYFRTNLDYYGRRIRGNAIFRGIKIAFKLYGNAVSSLAQISKNGMTCAVRKDRLAARRALHAGWQIGRAVT